MAYEWFSIIFLALIICHSQVRGRLVAKYEHTENSEKYQNEAYRGERISPGIMKPILASFRSPQEVEANTARYWAIYQTFDSSSPFYGCKVQLNVYGVPNLKSNQQSMSAVWLANGADDPPKYLNVIQAGWQVNPALYHDNDVHFFVSWTSDGYRSTGCFDLLCKGFVLDSSSKLMPGSRLAPVSQYDGRQHYITIRIQKDLQTGDWWVYRDDGDNAGPVGYWPKSLFTTLADSASTIELGGFTRSSSNDSAPPMGSGHLSSEGEGKAAYIKNIKAVNAVGDLYTIIKDEVSSFVNAPKNCYDVGEFKDSNSQGGSDGYAIFLFGGPGCANN